MLNAREHAAPVTAVDRLVNHSTDFHVNPVATQNPVVDAPEQIKKPALFTLSRLTVGLVTVSPCFGFVLRHYSPQIILLLGEKSRKMAASSIRGNQKLLRFAFGLTFLGASVLAMLFTG